MRLSLRSILVAALVLSSTALAVPNTLGHQGRLADSTGAPLDGNHTLTFSLYANPSGGSSLWQETQSVDFEEGFYAVDLGVSEDIDPALFDGDEPLYLGVSVDGGAELGDRLPLNSAPTALWADSAGTAVNVSGGIVDATEIRVNGNVVIDGDGKAAVSWDDLTGIPSDFADGSDDGDTLPVCSDGELLQYDSGDWQCVTETDLNLSFAEIDGTIAETQLPFGTGSADVARGSSTITALGCEDGEVAQMVDGAWECVSMGGGGGGALLFNFELDGPAPFADTSGNGGQATTDGFGLAVGSAGHSGQAVNFTGGLVTVGEGNAIFSSPYATVEAWVRPADPTNGTQTILQKEGAWSLTQERASTDDTATIKFAVTTQKGTTCTVESTLIVEAGKWSHVSGAYNGRTVAVSVDDAWIENDCAEGPIANSDGDPLNIGAASGKANSYNGLIDEVRGWSYAPPSAFYNYGGDFDGSTLLNPQQMARINEWASLPNQRWKLCYKKSVHGASASEFHSRCDHRGATVTILESQAGPLIGGYAEVPWTRHRSEYRGYSGRGFLFSLTLDEKYPIGYNYYYEIYTRSDYGPTFGDGHDIHVQNNMTGGYCNFPYAYSDVDGYSQAGPQQSRWQKLCGFSNANSNTGGRWGEIEVFIKDQD